MTFHFSHWYQSGGSLQLGDNYTHAASTPATQIVTAPTSEAASTASIPSAPTTQPQLTVSSPDGATALEQHILDLINEARANPAGEAARLGIDLNEGLPAGTISTAAEAPLVLNAALNQAADAHSADMLMHGYFSHTGSDGSSPADRTTAAGYEFSGNWTWGENIAYRSGAGVGLDQTTADALETSLFLSPSHRENLLNPAFHEVGIGLQAGDYQGSHAAMLTEDFAASSASDMHLIA
jgi:serralysin